MPARAPGLPLSTAQTHPPTACPAGAPTPQTARCTVCCLQRAPLDAACYAVLHAACSAGCWHATRHPQSQQLKCPNLVWHLSLAGALTVSNSWTCSSMLQGCCARSAGTQAALTRLLLQFVAAASASGQAADPGAFWGCEPAAAASCAASLTCISSSMRTVYASKRCL